MCLPQPSIGTQQHYCLKVLPLHRMRGPGQADVSALPPAIHDAAYRGSTVSVSGMDSV